MKMKNLSKSTVAGLTAAILSLSLSFPSFADDDSDRKTKRDEIRGQFDADGNGEISDRERQAARETFKAKRMERIDTDGNGEISKSERAAVKEKRKAKIVKRFDTDGDGELNERERESAKQAREKFRERRQANREG
tara:strand:- start:32721 stop:33128 length:408 start_codon:yes stop_codon:yes gene_type:complete